MSNLEGAILSDYLLLQCISKGSVADVYRACQNDEGNHEVAAKVYCSTFARRASFREYFMMEAEKIGQLEHPNILPLLEFGEGEDLLYVVMPYVGTGTLGDLLKRVGGKLSALQALPVVQQLCSAIQYAHNQGIVHGNLKLSNIFVAADGRILLSDFGSVYDYADSQQSLTRAERRFAEYAAPERSLGVLKFSSDIYSLGALLFRLLAGQPPFTGQTPGEVLLKHVRQEPPSIRLFVPTISDAIDDVLQMALQKRGEERFASIEEFSNAFSTAASVAPVASPLTRLVSRTNPLTPPVALPLPRVEPHTPIPVGRVQVGYHPMGAGLHTSAPLAQAGEMAQVGQQHIPRITRQLSPSCLFEGNDAGNGSGASHLAEQNGQGSQQTYFEPGIVIGKQHFWSAEPVEWSPIGNLQGNTVLRNDIPLHASSYLHDKADKNLATNSTPESSHRQQLCTPVTSFEGAVAPKIDTSAKKAEETDEGRQSALALVLHRFLPIIVVILLLLGLLGALLSSAFFPAGSSGANITPLHSVSGMVNSLLTAVGR